MEPPSPFLHHHHHHHPRYVPLPHHPPPPPPPNLPEDRNIYPQHHLLPPPPPLIQRPSYHPLPPAPSPLPLPPPPIPSYSPRQSQFTYLPIEDDLRRSHLLDFSHRSPARVFDRSPFRDDLHRIPIPQSHYTFPDPRPDSWTDRPRVPPENWAPLSFDCEPLHHPRPLNDQVHLSPFRTADNHRHDLEGSFRFRDDFIDGFESNHNEEVLRGRNDSRSSDLDSNHSNSHDHYVSYPSGSFRSFAFGDSLGVSNPNPPRDLGSNLRNYQSCHGLGSDSNRVWNNRDESRRWGHARSPSRNLSDAPVESENNEFGNAEGFRVVSSRRMLHNYDSGKLNCRGSREGNQEFLPSPRKKIQKKSALLRIQFSKPHNRSRNDEQQHFPPARSDNSDPRTFRNRGAFVYPDNRMDENREGSPVELDVSFKSNALVAKAIVASSSHGVESNRKLTARNRKNRKRTGPDINVLNSPLTKLNDGPMESNSSSNALDCPTISYEDSKQSVDNVNDSGVEALCGIGSQPRSCGTHDLPGTRMMKEPILDKGGNIVGPDGTYSLKNMKKKKVISAISYMPTSLEMKKSIDPVEACRSVDDPPTVSQTGEDDMHLKEKTTSPDMVLAHNVDRQCSPNEVTALFSHTEVNESHRAIVSEDNGSDIDSSGSHAHACKRTRNSSTNPFSSSSPLDINVEEGTVIPDRSADLRTISNSEKSPVELQNGISFSRSDEVGDLSWLSCPNEPPVSLQNGLVKGGLEAKLLVGGSFTTDLSSPGEIKIHGDPANLYSTFLDLHNASNPPNGLIKEQTKITDYNIDAMGAGSEFNEATAFTESIEVDGLSRAIPLVECNAIVVSSSSGETNIDEGVFDVHNSSNHFATSGFDNVPSDSHLKIIVSEIDLPDDNSKESCPDGANVFLGNVPMEGPTKAQAVDTALNYPVTDLGFAEEDVLGYGPADSQPCTNKGKIGNGYSLTKRSFDSMLSVNESLRIDQNGTSPKYVKKKKICAPVSPSPMLPSNIDSHLSQSEDKVAVSNVDVVCSPRFPFCSDSTMVLLENTEAGEAIGLVREGLTGNVSEIEQESPCSSGLGGEQKEKDALVMTVMTTVDNQIDIFDTERGGRGEKVSGINIVEEPGMRHIETDQPKNPFETQALDTENFNTNISLDQVLKEKSSENVRKQDDFVFEGLSSLRLLTTSLQDTTINNKSGPPMGSVFSIDPTFEPQVARKATRSLNTMSRVINTSNNRLTSAISRVFPGHSSSKKTVSSSQIATSRSWHRTGNTSASPYLGKHSYSNPVPPKGQSATKFRKDQTASYIRKGNSLVRKPSPVAAPASVSHALSSSVYRLNPTGLEEMKKKTEVKNGMDFAKLSHRANLPSYLGTGLDANLERPKTPPLPCSTKLSNCATTFSSRSGASSPVADHPPNGCSETEFDPLKLNENMDVPKPSEDDPNSSGTRENLTGRNNNFESQSVQDDGNSVTTKSGKIVYVKRKSNQLVAASSSGDLSLQNVDKTEAPPSDDYYKKRKNQIIRKSSETNQKVAMPVESLSSEGKRALPVIASRFTRKRSGKGLTNTCKPSKFSFVWTLRDAVSLKKDNTVIRQVWPHLFPWKRATHWRNLMYASASVSNNSSSSTIRKLLLSRKRETIYTRSTRGFSLRKSKVLSVGGSSLKWSKSIERNSKKANEEATLAVAAVEKKKREQNDAVTVGTKHRNHSSRKSVHSIELRPGERIFRVGSFRYKMDPTRRTLQRISDKELSNSVAIQSGKDAKKYSVPKRLLIGNDEYVRIGNGNQLIRDPKKRTRILASEKVRWSLHTARLRLARKRKYCQFFTRFGKCNKEDGKCPYIHDASKIAVCTKFLKGSCSDPNCKLTHKVIPERMQDCSYFLQGLCTNETCPYRHVNVNPNAPICEGFLRGYCADGNECRKKHSYVCPVFEATGICTQGSKCKLHHPKNRNKGKKRKLSGEQKNGRGRYFGSGHIDLSECRFGISEKHSAEEENDVFYQGGRFADYIHLGVCDEETGEIDDPMSEETNLCDGEPMDGQLDIDELIKPMWLMNKGMMAKSSPAMDRTTGNISEDSCRK